MESTTEIRPHPETLRQLPTIRVETPETAGEAAQEYCRATGSNYKIELKRETESRRYWLITECVGEPYTGWREGVALMVCVETDDCSEFVPYTATETKGLQGLDYLNKLMADLNRLLAEPWSWEGDKVIRDLRGEIVSLTDCQGG